MTSNGLHSSSPSGRITSLTRPTSTQIQSSLIIPTYPSVLSELLHNSLDANSSRISILICAARGDERVRVEDDGCGVSRAGLRRVGRRYESSKELSATHMSGASSYGFRGESLSSIAALGLVDITSRARGSRKTYSKIIKGSRVLYEGTASRPMISQSGTIVSVRELFHNVPVRQKAMASMNFSSIILACKRVVEGLALVWPNVEWTLWEESASSSAGSKKILGIEGAGSSIDVFRMIYGTAGVENIRVTAGQKRLEGFISLSGLYHKASRPFVTRANFRLTSICLMRDINHYPTDKGVLQHDISKRFQESRFSRYNQDQEEDLTSSAQYKRRSPRRLEKFPIYVLNVILPSEEVDVAYKPQKSMMGYNDEDQVKALILAVVDEFLKRHGYVDGPPAIEDTSHTRAALERRNHTQVTSASPLRRQIHEPAARSASRPPPASVVRSMNDRSHATPEKRKLLVTLDPVTPTKGCKQRRLELPEELSDGSHDSDDTRDPETPPRQSRDVRSEDEDQAVLGQESMLWLENLISQSRLRSHQRARQRWTGQAEDNIRENNQMTQQVEDIGCSHDLAVDLPQFHHTSVHLKFSPEALDYASILGQIDKKFIACVLPSHPEAEKPSRRVLVAIDQHAADERVRVEHILKDLCEGFTRDSVATTELETNPNVVVSREEAEILSKEGVLEVFRRWGMCMELPNDLGEYNQVEVRTVPTLLHLRLGRKEGTEMTRLIKFYISILSSHLREFEAFMSKCDEMGIESRVTEDWHRAARWMPKEMIELANSKACRGAIMFGDKLDRDQCERLLHRLKGCKTPFVCAHGRPSLIPLVALDGERSERRDIDWKEWSNKHNKRDTAERH